MPSDQAIVVYQVALQFIGAFVSFSIASISFKGMKQTSSSTLLRLATAFLFLGFGFLIEGLVGLGNEELIPGLTTFTATLFIAGMLLETAGYFFLAFSHAIDVIISKKMGIAMMLFPIISISTTQLIDTLKILSFYFVLYGVVETLYAYARNRRPDTLLIACALGLIASGFLVEWLSMLYPWVNVLSLIQIIIKEMGLVMLFIPVIRFMLAKGGGWDGSV